jgi:hypothetical protein
MHLPEVATQELRFFHYSKAIQKIRDALLALYRAPISIEMLTFFGGLNVNKNNFLPLCLVKAKFIITRVAGIFYRDYPASSPSLYFYCF